MFRKCEYVQLDYDYEDRDIQRASYDNIKLPKRTCKGLPKMLIVIDAMPSDAKKARKLMHGYMGDLMSWVFNFGPQFYHLDLSIDNFQWLVVSYNSADTSNLTDTVRARVDVKNEERLKYIVENYKPEVVLTFGRRPTVALSYDYMQNFQTKRGVAYHHFYGVPINAEVNGHKFKHVSSLSITNMHQTTNGGGPGYLLGYIARNVLTALNHGRQVYRIPKMEYKVRYIDTVKKFKRMMRILKDAPEVAIDTETRNLYRIANSTLIIQFACSKDEAFIVPIAHKDSTWLPEELEYVKESIRKYVEAGRQKRLLFANATFDIVRLRKDFGVRHIPSDIWDVFAGAFALDENMKELTSYGGNYYSLLNLCMQYGNTDYYDAAFGKEHRATIYQVDITQDLLDYCAMDVVSLHHIKEQQILQANDSGHDKFESLVSEQISDKLHLFSAMEFHGSPIDLDHLFYLQSDDSPLVRHFHAVVSKLNDSKGVQRTNKLLMKGSGMPAVGLFGVSDAKMFNLRKRAHLETLFFDVLKLEPLNTGKSGKGKIDKEFQKKYDDVEEVSLYNEIQKINKLRSSYVQAFIRQWGDDEDMRTDKAIRPQFHFLRVVTGRSSATKPSLHQIPSRNSVTKMIAAMFPDRANLGEHIKRLFIARPGRIILKIDFSAHEVRCWSLISGDEILASVFQHGLDMRRDYKRFPHPGLMYKISTEGDSHKINAAYFFGMDITEVDKEKRDSVKGVIFGLIYQQSMRGVAKGAGQTLEAIKKLVGAFKKRFPKGVAWFDEAKEFGRKHLFVESPIGRRRYLWPLMFPTSMRDSESKVAAAERRAVNSPVQGFGSDFLDMGARVIEEEKWRQFKETGHYPDFHTTNSVHDSLEFSVAYEDVWNAIRIIEYGLTEGAAKKIKQRFPDFNFTVPLEIDFEIGANLRDCGGWDYSLHESNGKDSFNSLIRKTLEFQRDELGYELNVNEVYKHITEGQYDDMPHWAQCQLWNVKKMRGKDPRRKGDVLNKKMIEKRYKLNAS